MYIFFYHIPSAMVEGKWNLLRHPYISHKHAAERAIVEHFKGSDYPHEVDNILIKRGHSARAVVKKYRGVFVSDYKYDMERIKE